MTGIPAGLTIDFETADRITRLNLEEVLDTLEKEVHNHFENGKWMHPEDLQEATAYLIPALKRLVKYYGGSYE